MVLSMNSTEDFIMKTIILAGVLFATTGAFGANQGLLGETGPMDPKRPGHPAVSVSVVSGDRAEAIFAALDVEEKEVEGPRGNVLTIKRAGPLKCLKGQKGEKSFTHCRLVGKKPIPHRPRHPRRKP